TIHRLVEERRLTTKECANKRGRGKVRVTYDGAELKEIGKARRAQSAGVSFTPGTVLLTIPAAAKEICFPERRLRKAIKKGKLKIYPHRDEKTNKVLRRIVREDLYKFRDGYLALEKKQRRPGF